MAAFTKEEAERAVTDNYTYINGHKFEDGKRYKAVGNGWTVDVIAHIFTHLKRRADNEQRETD